MKPFDLEKAKAGAPVCTRDGRDVRIICYDRKNDSYPIIALVTYSDGGEEHGSYTIDGYIHKNNVISGLDLMMKNIKHEGWINIYACCDEDIEPTHRPSAYVYPSKERALDNMINDDTYRDTVKIEWEE